MKRINLRKTIKSVAAHCDVPCGIYETDSLKTAGKTSLKLIQVIKEIMDEKTESSTSYNDLVRAIYHKERQAEICKQQILILWADYFKAKDFEENDDLHRLLNETAKQASMVKQTTSLEAVEKLNKLIDQVATIFEESKKSK